MQAPKLKNYDLFSSSNNRSAGFDLILILGVLKLFDEKK